MKAIPQMNNENCREGERATIGLVKLVELVIHHVLDRSQFL